MVRPVGERIRRGSARTASFAALAAIVSACFTYAPVSGAPAPLAGQRLAFAISDQGRAALADQVANGVVSIEGTLLSAPDGEYNISVFAVSTIAGKSHWSGERVSLRRDHVTGVLERRFSQGRTAAAIGATVVAVGAFIVTRGLFGTGSPDRDGGGGGNPVDR